MERCYRNSFHLIIIGCFLVLVFLQSRLFLSSPNEEVLSKKDCTLEADVKQRFWNTALKNVSQFICSGPDKNTSKFSYFVSENFKEVKCLKRKIEFAKENMTQEVYDTRLSNYVCPHIWGVSIILIIVEIFL